MIADTKHITIGIGVPTKNDRGICISMILFHPDQARQTYSKKYLHSDEEAFFVSGQSDTNLIANTNIALAICYEVSVSKHSEDAYKSGAEFYLASVVKSVHQVDKAIERLADIATEYAMTVLMSNSVGQSDGMECGGRTSIWNNQGLLLEQLDDVNEAIIIIDTETQELIKLTI